MRFWDSSAILCLLAEQPGHEDLKAALGQDPDLILWWGTRVELASGLCRLHRMDLLDAGDLAARLKVAEAMCGTAHEADPTDKTRELGIRAVRLHGLTAADAMQLAAALAWTDNSPSGAGFVCLDKRLREAAEKEGFTVLPE